MGFDGYSRFLGAIKLLNVPAYNGLILVIKEIKDVLFLIMIKNVRIF